MALQQIPNYNIDIPDASKAFEEGMVWRQQQKQQETARAEGEAIKRDIQALGPNPTVENITNLVVKYPALAERFKEPLKMLSERELQNKQSQAIPIYAALMNGQNETAVSLLQQQADAARNSGNEAGAKAAEAQIKLIQLDAPTAKTAMGVTMAALMGGDKFSETFKGMGEEGRAQEEQPINIRQKTANAIKAELDAKYAPEKIAAELGLTGAQTEQAKAAARASNAAARRSDAEATGVNSALIPPEKRPELELKLRSEYEGATKEYRDVKSAYGRVLASQPTAAGDLSLIFNYMKMLDPGSAVREGEFANAQNAGSVSTAIRNIYNKMVSGERLSESQRNMFSGQAKSLYEQSAKGEATVRSGLTRIATGYGLSPTNIFYEAVETAPAAPGAAAPPPAAVVPPPSAATAGGVGSQVRVSVKY